MSNLISLVDAKGTFEEASGESQMDFLPKVTSDSYSYFFLIFFYLTIETTNVTSDSYWHFFYS